LTQPSFWQGANPPTPSLSESALVFLSVAENAWHKQETVGISRAKTIVSIASTICLTPQTNNVAPLRESKKSLLNDTVKQYAEKAKRKFHATAQRRNVKDSIPQLRQTFNG